MHARTARGGMSAGPRGGADPESAGCAGDPPPLPHFEVQITPPRLDAWLTGNTGIPGFWSFAGQAPGPHVCVTALNHGNEIAGAVVLDRLLRERLRPLRGRLTLGFINLAAYARFDPRQPTASRFVEEDFNRLWDPAVLEGPRRSAELTRAREIRPLIDSVDVLLDLHSMLWPSEPLVLCGASPKGRDLAALIGYPALVVADRGHASGPRLIDYPPFLDAAIPRAAVLVEAGQHWERATIEIAAATVARLLHGFGLAEGPAPFPPTPQRFATVTTLITAATTGFVFTHPYRGGDIVPARGTLIACDGGDEIRTPHDDCLLVMPSLRPSRGHTAVRLARLEAGPG